MRVRQPQNIEKTENSYTDNSVVMIRDLSIPVYIARDNIILLANPALQKITGYSADELIGKSVSDIIHPEDRPLLPAAINKKRKNTKATNREIRIIRKGGRARLVQETSIALLFQGKPATLGTLVEITEDKSLEKRLKRLRQMLRIIQNMNQLIALETNAEWLIQSACQIFISSLSFRTAWIAILDESWKFRTVAQGGLGKELQPLIKRLKQGDLPPCARRALAHSSSIVILSAVPADCEDCTISKNICGDASMSIRLGYQDKTYGVLSASAPRGTRFNEEEQALFKEVSQRIGYALYTIEMEEKSSHTQSQLEMRARILDLANDAFFVHEVDGYFIYVNEMACKMTGYSRDELSKMKTPDVVASQFIATLDDKRRRIDDEGDTIFESARLRKDGSIVPVEVHSGPIEIDGKTLHFDIVRDITDRKIVEEALQASKEHYRTLFNSLSDAVYIHDMKGKFIEANQVTCERLRYQREELLKLNVENIIPGTSFIPLPKLTEKLMEKSPRVFQTDLVTKDGVLIPIEVNVRIVDYEHQKAILSVARDITERKTMERELEEKVTELEKANEQLRELDRLKDNFLSTVSHELRTPLTSIKSFAEILLSYDEDRATQKEFLGIINEESERLTRLINDFLDLSKIQAGRMQWQTADVPVKTVAEAAINIARPVLEKNRITLTVDIEPDLPLVLSDRDKVQQVFTNLIGNATKFTPEGGSVGIKIWLSKGDGTANNPDMVTTSISDTGIGIAPENHEKIFEKFGQVGDVLKDRPKGTGLGLPICKKIIENFGGTIRVESALGKGSTFIFTMPVSRGSDKSPTQAVMPAPTEHPVRNLSTKKTIMVVDDESNIRKVIKHELERRGHTVIEAGGGIQAVDLAREYHPDLITLDIVMPDLDGFDVTAVLKTDPATKNIPILVISVIEDKKKVYQLGANDYVTKPLSNEILMESINRLLQGAQRNILIVDDEKPMIKSLEFELRKHGFITTAAFNGKQAMKAIEKQIPNLIILDIKMPEMDGYEVIKALKGKPETENIPIILMTGIEIDGGRVQALSIGADEYIQKSEGFTRLFEAIDKILAEKPKS